MVDDEIRQIVSMLDDLSGDTSVPRNVRNKITEGKTKLATGDDVATRISGAIYALDEVSNDINLPMHARTMIWNLLSELEALKSRELGK